jgi:hypothetical protein
LGRKTILRFWLWRWPEAFAEAVKTHREENGFMGNWQWGGWGWPGRAVILGCVAGLCALAMAPRCGAVVTPATTLTIEDLGKGTAKLDGPWQFHLGDDAGWAAVGVDDAAGQGGWETLTADTGWGTQGHPSYTGYGWYRKHVHITMAPGAAADVAIAIPHIDDVYELYWNGQRIAVHGTMPPRPSYFYGEGEQTFGLGAVRDGVLAVRVWKAPLNSFDNGLMGGFAATPVVGAPVAIAALRAQADYRWLRSQQYFFALQSLYGLVALLSLLFWLRDRSQRVLLWMAVYCASPVVAMFLVELRLPLSFNFALGWLQPVLSLHDVGLWFLLLWLLKLHDSPRLARFTKVLAIISIVATSLDGGLTMLDWSQPWLTRWAQLADAVLTVVFTLTQAFPLVLVVLGIRRRLDSARWMVVIFAFLSSGLFELRIALEQGSRFTHWTISDKLASPLFTISGNPFPAATLAETGLLLAIVYAVYRYSREAIERQQAIEQELKSAQELQQVLIPEELPSLKGFALTSAYRPASEVGGDFFQIIPLEGEHASSTLIVLGDVSGKGLRAAMTVSLIVGTVRTLAEGTADPAEILTGLNRRLHGRLRGGFATCLVMRLDVDGSCVLANAGHPAPFLNGEEIVTPGALPLGVAASGHYEEQTVYLRAGDHFAAYTDGLLEARAKDGELFSFDRLRDLFAGRPDAAHATEAAMRFGQQDDITVLTLTRLGVGEESRTELIAPVLAPA